MNYDDSCPPGLVKLTMQVGRYFSYFSNLANKNSIVFCKLAIKLIKQHSLEEKQYSFKKKLSSQSFEQQILTRVSTFSREAVNFFLTLQNSVKTLSFYHLRMVPKCLSIQDCAVQLSKVLFSSQSTRTLTLMHSKFYQI